MVHVVLALKQAVNQRTIAVTKQHYVFSLGASFFAQTLTAAVITALANLTTKQHLQRYHIYVVSGCPWVGRASSCDHVPSLYSLTLYCMKKMKGTKHKTTDSQSLGPNPVSLHTTLSVWPTLHPPHPYIRSFAMVLPSMASCFTKLPVFNTPMRQPQGKPVRCPQHKQSVSHSTPLLFLLQPCTQVQRLHLLTGPS
jgi:hypothetical protein